MKEFQKLDGGGEMKRRFFLILSLIVLIGIFSFAQDEKYYPEYTGEPVTITMWAWTSNENYSIEEFEKAYPNIKVQWENFGVHYTKAQTALAAGSGLPDVLMLEYTYANQFMDLGAFQPINKWLDEDTFIELYGEEALKWCSMDGEIYGTPQDSGVVSFFYRKDIFDKYGLKVPKTMEEFAEEARKLHEMDPEISFVTAPVVWVLFYIGEVWQAGGRLFDYDNGNWYIDFTNPTAEKVFEFWGELIDDGVIRLENWWTPDWYNALNTGKTAAVIAGNWFSEWLRYNAPDSEGLWRVAPHPQWDPNNPTNAMMGGSGFYVTAHSKNPEAAAIFVNWLNSHPESLKCLHTYSHLPVMVSTRYEEVIEELDAPDDYFGGQHIVKMLWDEHKLVNTAFASLPIMSNLDTILGQLNQDYLDGKIKNYADILPLWEKEAINIMKEFGYRNLITGEFPN
jgi:multiple sugar transport system substrate-binding protein